MANLSSGKTLSSTLVQPKQGDSACWADIMKVKELYTQNRKTVVGAGMDTSFWDDVWCTSHPLKNISLNYMMSVRINLLLEICPRGNNKYSYIISLCL